MKNLNLNSILIIAGFAALIYFLPVQQSEPIVKEIEKIETIIKDSIIYIDRVKEVVKIEKQYLDTLYIERYNTTDTVKIIQIQDTIIYKQKEVIVKQDTIINTQSGVIALKDSIITLERIKRKKQRRNIIKLTLVSIGTGIIAILK